MEDAFVFLIPVDADVPAVSESCHLLNKRHGLGNVALTMYS